MFQRVRNFLFTSSILILLANAAHAGISAPNSSAIVSPDGKRLLVMLSPSPPDDNTPTVALPDGRTLNLHDHFSKSGAYKLPDLTPDWTVDWFQLKWDLLWSPDFRYVVRRNRFALSGGPALSFYDRGAFLRSYDCSTLLPHLRNPRLLPFETWDWHSRWYDEWNISRSGDCVEFATARRQCYLWGRVDLGIQDHYEFETATGRIRSQHTSGVWVPFAYIAGIVIAIIAAITAIRRTIRFLNRIPTRHGFPME